MHAGAPASEKYPAGQGTQVAFEAAPVAALAVPAGQGVGKEKESGQNDPAGHCAQAAAPAAEKVPAAHGAHVAAEVAPTAADAVPGGQSVALLLKGGQ